MDLGPICHLPSINFVRRQIKKLLFFVTNYGKDYGSVSKIRPPGSKTVCKMREGGSHYSPGTNLSWRRVRENP